MRRTTRVTRRPRRLPVAGARAAVGAGASAAGVARLVPRGGPATRSIWAVSSPSDPTTAGAATADREETGPVGAPVASARSRRAARASRRVMGWSLGSGVAVVSAAPSSALARRRSGGVAPPAVRSDGLPPGLGSFLPAPDLASFAPLGRPAGFVDSAAASGLAPAPGRGGRFGPALAGVPPSPRPAGSAAAFDSAGVTTSGPASPEDLDTSGSVRDDGIPAPFGPAKAVAGPRAVAVRPKDQPDGVAGSQRARAVARTPRRSTVTCTSPPSSMYAITCASLA